jgi:hypothetical protein
MTDKQGGPIPDLLLSFFDRALVPPAPIDNSDRADRFASTRHITPPTPHVQDGEKAILNNRESSEVSGTPEIERSASRGSSR